MPGVVLYQKCVYFLCFISFFDHCYVSLEFLEMGIVDFTQVFISIFEHCHVSLGFLEMGIVDFTQVL